MINYSFIFYGDTTTGGATGVAIRECNNYSNSMISDDIISSVWSYNS